jgi:fumarate reductase flavoprotein subunit
MIGDEFSSVIDDTARRRDVIVVGGGITGLSAGMTAGQAGADVLLLEAGTQLGGTFRFYGGGIGGSTNLDQLHAHVPDGDAELQRQVTTNIRDDLHWLHSIPTPMGPFTENAHRGYRGMAATSDGMTDSANQTAYPPGLAVIMGRKIGHSGGEVAIGTRVVSAAPEPGGWRVTVQRDDGAETVLHTKAVVTAGGGFAANPDLMNKYMKFKFEHVWMRNSGLSDGIALRIGAENGGDIAGAMHTFYGHSLPAPPAKFAPENLLGITQNYGAYTPVLNVHGRRFVDEAASPPPREEDLVQAEALQPDGLVYYIFDSAIHRDYVELRSAQGMPGFDFADKLEAARRVGGPVWQADTLEALLGQVFNDPSEAISTVTEYNRAAVSGTADRLPIPKVRAEFAIAVQRPPFYAVAVRPGVTITMGGVKADTRARALTAGGDVIPGLYAAGADIGNIHNFHYVGGNGVGLVYGRIAAREAAAYAMKLEN